MDDAGFAGTSWQPFSQAAIQVELSAEMRVIASQFAVLFKNAFMAETSTGEALTHLSRSFFQNERESTIASQILVTLTCDATEGPYSIGLGELTFEHTDGATFRNVEGNSIVYPVTLNSGASLTLLVEAEVGGTSGNIRDALTPETVAINLQSTLAGVSVVAHTLDRSGVDEENDDRLTDRNQNKWATLSRLSLMDEAVVYEALRAAPAVQTVGVDSSNPRGIGTFDVYIAGLDSTAGAEDVATVQITIERLTWGRKNPMGKTVKVYAAPEVKLDINGSVYFAGGSKALIEAAVDAALVDYVRNIPCGGLYFDSGPQGIVPKNDLESVIRDTVMSQGATKCTVLLIKPTGDTPVGSYGKVVQGVWSLNYIQSTNS